MKYKILLTGNNKTIIDDLFAKTNGRFEYQTTSSRYADLLSHLRHFKPDGFLYCINHEMPDSFRQMSDLKQSPEAVATAFFAIGTKAECDSYTRTVPGVVDLVMEKPVSITSMEEQMANYFISANTHKVPIQPAPPLTAPPAAANPVPVNSVQTETIPNTGAAQPQTGQRTPAPAPQPAASQAPSMAGTQQADTDTRQTAANVQKEQPSAAFADPNDELFLALTEQVDSAAKMINAVANMPVIDVENDHEENSNRRKHILVVDDDSRMLKIIKRHLSDKYDVATALNGRLALKFLETKKTNLILLDYEMPLENGPAILKKLKENPFTHDIPVIFLTGISERDKIEKALVLKPQGYLLKPIDHIKLLSSISKLIG